MTYEQLLEHVRNFFSNDTREQAATKADLKALRDEIDMLIDSLDD